MIKTIALDAMGGDHGPEVTVPAAIRALEANPNLHLILVGQQDILAPLLARQGASYSDRWTIQHASESVDMDESPAQALRFKKDSSMRVAINCVKTGSAQACVSAGNTGALMATARFVLKMLPGIDRPAIITALPTKVRDQGVHILDLGANVDSSPEHLYQFAVMGSILVSAVGGIAQPRVALLNNGEEAIKGNEQVKKAAELLQDSDLIHYVGYVEGDAIFSASADVIVCDGFVGNIALKVSEGVAKLIGLYTREAVKETWWTRLLVLPAIPVLKRLMRRADPRRYNGATLLGLNGIVVKSHGSADVASFTHAINEAVLEVDNNLVQLIREQVGDALEEGEVA